MLAEPRADLNGNRPQKWPWGLAKWYYFYDKGGDSKKR